MGAADRADWLMSTGSGGVARRTGDRDLTVSLFLSAKVETGGILPSSLGISGLLGTILRVSAHTEPKQDSWLRQSLYIGDCPGPENSNYFIPTEGPCLAGSFDTESDLEWGGGWGEEGSSAGLLKSGERVSGVVWDMRVCKGSTSSRSLRQDCPWGAFPVCPREASDPRDFLLGFLFVCL